ncbi:MAG: hypothetical protein VX347_00690 [Bacteroidota bacterium]|nr:hypothetical protein [Bacteroidota bacterium]
MLRFLGINKKQKIKALEFTRIYVENLNDVIDSGFIEIKDFINENNNLECTLELKDFDIKWFWVITFLANLSHLNSYFEEEEALQLRGYVLDNILNMIDENNELAMEKFLNYENYFSQLMSQYDDVLKSMAFAIFEKYNINDFQGDMFKKKNQANPILIHELKNLLSHFLWDWDDDLRNHRIIF